MSGKYEEAQRKVNISDAAERALKLQLWSAEQAARGLKEEMGRMRILVGQTRAQCANEARKREKVIDGLKRHVGEGGRARGSGKAVGVAVVTVTPGVGREDNAGSGMGTDDTGYDLRSETNEFLTELARGLSEENESLGGLVRKTVETLRTLSGCEKDGQRQDMGMVQQMENGYEILASEMDFVIEHLRNLLTNPSFVPIEEVEVREEEIVRLREGWEKMESRWRDAVQMMEGWRKRMARSGQTVNLEELKMGLMLSPLKAREDHNTDGMKLSMVMEGDEGSTQADIDAMAALEMPADEMDEDLSDSDQSLFDEDPVDAVSEELSEEQGVQDATINTVSSASPGPPSQLSPLKETTKGNRGSPVEPRAKAFTTIIEENTFDLLQLDASSPTKPRPKSPSKRDTTPRPTVQPSQQEPPISPSDEISLVHAPSSTSARSRSHSRSPSRSPTPKKSSTNLRSEPRATQPTASSSARLRARSRSPTPKKSSTNLRSESNPSSSTTPHLSTTSAPKLLPPQTQPSRNVNGNANANAKQSLELGPSSRLPRPRNEPPPPQQSPLTMATIAAKLAATEREADAARVRAKLKAARGKSGSRVVSAEVPSVARKDVGEAGTDNAAGDATREEKAGTGTGTRKRNPVAGKKRSVSGRTNRRRSTLSPWELESLMLGGVGASPGRE